MKRLFLITAALLALTSAGNAGDKLPAVYLGHWCSTYSGPEDDPNLYSAKKPGVECASNWLMLKPHKLVDADGERECRYRSIKNTTGRLTETTTGRLTEIVAYCRAEEAPGYIRKFWLSHSREDSRMEEEDRHEPEERQSVANTAEQADPKIIATLKKRFPTIAEDNVWIDLTGGYKCGGCPLVWFETDRANWACNIDFADVVKIKNCWKRHA